MPVTRGGKVMRFDAFSISRLPSIIFGEGTIKEAPGLASRYGKRVLVVTGAGSFVNTQRWSEMKRSMNSAGIIWDHITVEGEPSPQLVDESVRKFSFCKIEAVIGIGGGSVLDAAKAIAGLLTNGNSVMDHLVGVGPEIPYEGPSVPFIAVPTTAGTGSEATKNSVLSKRGPDGFKKSFRHDLLVAQYAVIDPELLDTCPAQLIAASGMDAVTQLVESYVSAKSNPLTDALALSGIVAARDGLLNWYEGGDKAAEGRRAMAYAALISGITLAQAPLGAVHGLASPLGAFFPVPHGVVCGTLAAAVVEANIRAMREREPGNPAIEKYAQLGELFAGKELDFSSGLEAIVKILSEWTERMKLPGLGVYGMKEMDIGRVVAGCRGGSMKTNPIVLTDDELAGVLMKRL